jgi:AcrR family transcriptional regulator
MSATAPEQPTRRGRPRARASTSDLAPREQILRAAAALFSSRGIGATRVADIAEEVGLTAPAIYYHFANLDEIVEALLDYVVGESAAFATTMAELEGRPAERLHALVTQHVTRLTAGPYDLWFVAGVVAAEPGRYASIGRKANQWRRAVARLVAEGTTAGELRDIDPAVAVAAVSGLVYGALQHHHVGASIDATLIADLAVRALSRAGGASAG